MTAACQMTMCFSVVLWTNAHLFRRVNHYFKKVESVGVLAMDRVPKALQGKGQLS